MLNLKEYREHPDRLSDLLPWAMLIAPGIILNKDGSFQTTIRYRGPDLDSATDAELISISARLNNVLRRLGSGWAIYSEAKRVRSDNYPTSHFPEPISFLIDEERRVMFEAETHYESLYYLTFVYLPPSDSTSRIASTFLENKPSKELQYSNILASFGAEVGRIVNLLQGIFNETEHLSDEELLSYLHATVSEKSHPIVHPENPVYLDSILVDSPLLPGFEPRLGETHLKVIGVKSFPGKSQPGLLDRLNRLSIEYRWVTRFICLDKNEAEGEINRYKKRWFAKRKGIVTLLKETITGAQSVMEDSDAVNKAMDADAAQQELQEDLVSYGYFTNVVVLWDKDLVALNNKSREVERIINSLGFATKPEDINAVDAWLGSIPGNCRNNVRRPLLNTLNLAHLMPLSAVWAGPENDEHLGGPPLFYARTNGSTQFRYVSHVGDVGHSLIIGPTGTGKSVLLNLIEAQFLRYSNAQVYIFDKGGSSRTLTAGVGGDYYDLGADDSELSFQPLANVDELPERRFASEWLVDILVQENVTVTPAVKEELWTALNSLASAPLKERTIFGLTVLLQNEELRQALLPFTISGAHGGMLDNTHDNLRYGFWQSFEMEVLMETPAVVMPVLSYLFHRLERRFTGKPTLLVIDEAWLFLDNPAFAAKIREWLKVLRKANVMVVFATQSLADVDGSVIAATIKEACFTKIYLPNATALNEDASAFYRRFGLNERQIRILAEAIPKRNYYYTSPLGNRLFDLGLDELALAYCGATSKEVQTHVKALLKNATTPEEFNRKYLKAQNLTWALDSLRSILNEREVA